MSTGELFGRATGEEVMETAIGSVNIGKGMELEVDTAPDSLSFPDTSGADSRAISETATGDEVGDEAVEEILSTREFFGRATGEEVLEAAIGSVNIGKRHGT